MRVSAPARRLALGTVQFGQTYGIANQTGQVDRDQVAQILDVARAAGLDTVDTAIAYGEAETRLGEVGVDGWRIVSKLPEMPNSVDDVAGWVESNVTGSLERLGVDQLHGLLLHRPLQLAGEHGAELRAALVGLKDAGLTTRVGVSVYGPDELAQVWDEALDLVQAPYNVLDRRLSASGWLDRLADAGVEVHTRSAFLQGLLLMDDRPSSFDRWADVLGRWDAWVEEQECSPLQAALGAVLADDRIDRVVVGVDSLEQCEEILDAVAPPFPPTPDSLASHDIELVDPSRWELS